MLLDTISPQGILLKLYYINSEPKLCLNGHIWDATHSKQKKEAENPELNLKNSDYYVYSSIQVYMGKHDRKALFKNI